MGNQTQEALKMAIEALQNIDNWLPTIGQRGLRDYEADALQACKEAIVSDVTDIDVGEIAQPSSKNIRDSFNEMLEDKVAYYKGKQPAQEPSKLEMAGFELDGVIADGYREGLDNVSLSTIKRVRKTISDYVEQPAQEPVAVITPDNYGEPRLDFIGTFKYKATTAVNPDILLYTHPAPATKPLSESALFDLYKKHAYEPYDATGDALTPFGNFVEGFRSAEKAHGIGEQA